MLVDMPDFKVKGEDGKGNTSLHIAAQNKKCDMIEVIFARAKKDKDKINGMRECLLAKNNKKQMPLHISCQMGDYESVESILELVRAECVRCPWLLA